MNLFRCVDTGKMARSNKSKAKRPWQDVAKEAQEYRNTSIDQVPGGSALSSNVLSIPKNMMSVPETVLSHQDCQITQSLPEELVKLLADGQLSATEVTLAFLRRAAITQKLASRPPSPEIPVR